MTNRTAKLSATPQLIESPEKIPTVEFSPAYTGGLLRMNPEVWPLPTVFDVDGLEERPQEVPILRDHDQGEKVGQTTSIDYTGGQISAVGRLLNYGIDPAASKIVALWKRGAKLEASVATGIIAPEDVETIPPGTTATANGQTFDGPIEIVRRWRLKEISIVTLGADDAGTSVVIGNAAGSFASSKGVKFMATRWPRLMRALGLAPGASKPDALRRVAKAASEGTPLDATVVKQILEEAAAEGDDDPNKTGVAEGEDDPNKTAIAEGEIDPTDPKFIAFAADLGIDDVLSAAPEIIDVAKAAYAKFAAAEGEDDPNKTGVAEGEDDPNKTAIAEGEDDPNKTGSASRGQFGRTAWSKTKYPASLLGSQTRRIEGTRRPTPARVAEASLMTAGGSRPNSLKSAGYSDAEIDEATRRENRNMGIKDLLYRTGAASPGYGLDGFQVAEILGRAWQDGRFGRSRVGQAAGILSTTDIPNILANVMHKSLLNGVNAIPDPTDQISRVVSASDFRDQNFVNLFLDGEFAEMKRNSEMESLKATDVNYTNRASIRAYDLKLAFEDIANDDMNALTDAPRIMGRKAGIRKQQIFWSKLADNLANIATATGNPKLTVAGLDKVCAKFEQLTEKDDGDLIGAQPRFLLVPTALKATAFNLVNATQVLATGGPTSDVSIVPNTNRYASMFEVVSTPFLGSGSKNATNWGDSKFMILADPADVPLMMISYYQNQRAPTVQSVYGQLPVDGLRIACWWAFGVSVMEKRSAVLSAGSGS